MNKATTKTAMTMILNFVGMVNSIPAMLETIALLHPVCVAVGTLIFIIVGVELVGVVVHACVVSIVVWIHAVAAIIVGCSAHLNSPILKLMAGHSGLDDLISGQIQGCLWYISKCVFIRLTAKSKPCIAPS